MKCYLLSPFQKLLICAVILRPIVLLSAPLMYHMGFELMLITVIWAAQPRWNCKPFCYKPHTLKIVFVIYCTYQGRAPATFNAAGNPGSASTDTPLQKGCRTVTITCWKMLQEAFFPPSTSTFEYFVEKCWPFGQRLDVFWSRREVSAQNSQEHRLKCSHGDMEMQLQMFTSGKKRIY